MFMINSGHNTLSWRLGLSSILALNKNMKRTPFSTESQLILFHPAITSDTIVVIYTTLFSDETYDLSTSDQNLT